MKCEVQYFFDFDKHTLENLSKVMQQKVFDKGQIIYSKGDASVDMYVVL